MDQIAALSSEDWHRLNRLLARALELEPAERAAWLDSQPLEGEVRAVAIALLARSKEPTSADEASGPCWLPASDRPGDLIGPYRLERELAHGGMGVVWLAQRADGSFERRVALKLPRAEWAAPGLAQRMARERSVLAGLSHPNIAQLYDAGWTADGRPYLAIEYVDGVPIDAYCAVRGLALRERVRLFAEVARAVAFAQTRLVVHRDLKPANVLVTAEGAVKLLDFGIAKLLEGEAPLAGETALTRVGGRALTLHYAAPEQVRGEPVSAATDVYALGVMLYELLSGVRFYGTSEATAPGAIEHAVLHAEPVRPSRAAPAHAATLRGDLDTIVMLAVKKSPAERYASAAAFVDDLERFLKRQPIRARPDSRRYRARMFVARNRTALLVASAFMTLLVASSALSVWQARTAMKEARRSEAIKNFVLSMIRQADPAKAAVSREADAVLLAAAEQRIDEELRDRPDVAIELRVAVGEAYLNRGFHDRARAAFARAVSEGASTLPVDHRLLALARIRHAAGFVLIDDEGLRNLDLAIDTARRLGHDGHELLVEGLLLRAGYADVRRQSADSDLQEAYRLSQEYLSPGSGVALDAAARYAYTFIATPKAQAVLHEALDRVGDSLPVGHPSLLRARALLGFFLAISGHADEGVKLTREVVLLAREHHDESSKVLELALFRYGGALWYAGFPSTGLAIFRATYEVAAAREPAASFNLLERRRLVVHASLDSHAPGGLEDLVEAGLRAHVVLPPGRLQDAWQRVGRKNLGYFLLETGQTEKAEDVLRDVCEAFDSTAPKASGAAKARLLWARAALENGYAARALEILAPVERSAGADWPLRHQYSALAHLALAQPQQALAEVIVGRTKYASVHGKGPPKYAFGADLHVAHSRALLVNGRAGEAAEAAAPAHDFWSRSDPSSPWAAEAAYWYGRALLAAGDAVRGRELIRSSRPQLAASPIPSHRATAALAH